MRSLVARFEPVLGTIVADKYRVERVLGEGGMGVVVAATHLGLDQRVAIKFLLPEALRRKDAVERFQREAKVAAKIKSEHVTRVHDVGTLRGGEPFIVMEYLEGVDLRQSIKNGPLDLGEACEIALQACEALVQVHAAGIVHRDLKPSNLFVTRRADGSPCVKVLDFGISKFGWDGDWETDPGLTATATIMGSPSYMSPEQLKSTKEVDARTDVWSLGAVLYEALTGRPAFRGDTLPQVCAMIASDSPPPPSRVRAQVAPALDAAILGCLEKNPEKRARLVDLARALVPFAPERARVSLERVEAAAGGSGPRSRGATSDRLPVLSLATSARGRRRSRLAAAFPGAARRGARTGVALTALGLVGAALLAAGIWAGRWDVRALRRRLSGATSAGTLTVDSSPAPDPAQSEVPSSSLLPPQPAPATPLAAPPSSPPREIDDAGAPAAPPAALGQAPPATARPASPAHVVPLGSPVPRRRPAKPKHGAGKVRKHN